MSTEKVPDTFSFLDPFPGVADRPLSLHKYAYTSGDPIQFADPSGLFEGLIGLLGSLNISTSNRASQAPAHGQSLASAHRLQKLVRIVENLHNKLQKLQDTLDLFDNVTNILELSSAEINELKSQFSALSAIPSRRVGPRTISLPPSITRKLRTLVRMAQRFGGLNFLQEQFGEWGAAIAANAVGLQISTLRKPHGSNGIDQLRRHKDAGFWAIIEAKGGDGRLRGGQMSPSWIRRWIDRTIDDPRNSQNPERRTLKYAKDHTQDMLAVVFRVRTDRQTWQVKFTAQKFRWSTRTLSWPGA